MNNESGIKNKGFAPHSSFFIHYSLFSILVASLFIILYSSFFIPKAYAASVTWGGGAGTTEWNTGSNWSNDQI